VLQVAGLAAILGASQSAAPAHAAKQGGFVPVNDQGDAYKLLYPFGWQEVSVGGQDVVYKDIIEPLESVSVSITPSDKDDITLYGEPVEVAQTLADQVLTAPTQQVKVLNVTPRATEGRNYVEFEFAAKSNTYIRHALAVVTVANGKLYTLVTGANERRWDKVKSQLETVARSFVVATKY
jgi:photosystem II oxygen-evolving enhancer protein 2